MDGKKQVGKLRNRRILVGVTGSVATYKAVDLCRLLVKEGAKVQVAMTEAATKFVGPLSFQAVTGCPPVVDMFAGKGSLDAMDHIAAVRAANLYVIAPASATTLSKVACGSAEGAVAALACAATCPVMLAPAMNREMLANPAVVRNIESLRADGRQVLPSPEGDLACGEHGEGRLAQPEQILAAIVAVLDTKGEGGVLAGRKVVVSTGATVEALDDMRLLTNRSTGRMGCELALAAHHAGAWVHLLAGRTSVELPMFLPKVSQVEDGRQMLVKARRACRGADCFISVAAVADFRPARPTKGKPARTSGKITLELSAVPDIVATIAKGENGLKGPFCVAFSASAGDMDDALKVARTKMRAKGVDAILASPLVDNLGGMDCDLAFIDHRASRRLGRMSKKDAADKITSLIARRLPG